MNGTELLTQALILDIMVEGGLIDSDKMHDTLDELILKSRQVEESTEDLLLRTREIDTIM